jgi:hypothetical protein
MRERWSLTSLYPFLDLNPAHSLCLILDRALLGLQTLALELDLHACSAVCKPMISTGDMCGPIPTAVLTVLALDEHWRLACRRTGCFRGMW